MLKFTHLISKKAENNLNFKDSKTIKESFSSNVATLFLTGGTFKEQLRAQKKLEGHLKSTSKALGYTKH